MQVDSTTLEKVVNCFGFKQLTLVVDVEGAEADLVENEIQLMSQVVDTLIVELHPEEWGAGKRRIERTRELLGASGFVQVGSSHKDYAYKNRLFLSPTETS